MTDLRKPLRRKVTVKKIGHGYRPELVVTLQPGGILELRESRRREAPVVLDLATLYVKARIHEAWARGPKKQRRGRDVVVRR